MSTSTAPLDRPCWRVVELRANARKGCSFPSTDSARTEHTLLNKSRQASAESATFAQSRGRPYSADQVWPASPYVTYHEAEWHVPCGISTELTARVCNLLQSTLLPGEGPVWHSDLSLKIGQMTQPLSWPRLNIIHHTQWQLLLLEAQFSHLAIR